MAPRLDLTVGDLLPEAVIGPVVASIAKEAPGRWPVSVSTCTAHSNDRAEVRFDDGRALVVKRARYAWARERFAASRAAARLLHEAGIPAPRPLEIPGVEADPPVEVYWKLEIPTLGEVWEGAGRPERQALLRSWGGLVRRIHRIELAGHGPLLRPDPGGLGGYLRADLEQRLLPAVAWGWPQARTLVEGLAGMVDRVCARLGDAPATLVHNDLHAHNVLCAGEGTRCVGVLDLEAAFAGPAEADVAHAEVLHGPMFGKPFPASWLDELLRGYGRALDPVALAFFRAFHLANLGFHAVLCGYREHAAEVAAAAARELRGLRRGGGAGASPGRVAVSPRSTRVPTAV